MSETETRGLRKVLVVDDDEQIRKQVEWALREDYEVYSASNRSEALDVVRNESVPVVLLDLGLPPRPREADEGLAALEEILATDPLAKVIIVSGNSDRRNAVSAVERGAHDIFPKPLDLDQLRVVLERAHRRLDLERESIAAPGVLVEPEIAGVVGSSPKIRAVFKTVHKIAGTDVPVLVTGESGTGKERVAMALHGLSARKDGPFVPINCGAIPENLLESELFGHEQGAFTGAKARRKGKLEYADRGTLFLDEIGELALPLQVKLLRFLQERALERVGGRALIHVDARIVAATNVDLVEAARNGRFREDLYFRLAVVRLELPPLRERGDDVVALAEHFASVFAQELGRPLKTFSRQALNALRAHDWPGNVRELQNRVKRAVVLAEGPRIGAVELELGNVASPRATGTSLRAAKEQLEREMVAEALARNNGNISKTSRMLGISRPTLYELIARYGL